MEEGLRHIKIWSHRDETGPVLIAEVRNEHGALSSYGQEEHANAALFVTAPKLVRALHALIAYIDRTLQHQTVPWTAGDQAMYESAVRFLAEAEGRTPPSHSVATPSEALS